MSAETGSMGDSINTRRVTARQMLCRAGGAGSAPHTQAALSSATATFSSRSDRSDAASMPVVSTASAGR